MFGRRVFGPTGGFRPRLNVLGRIPILYNPYYQICNENRSIYSSFSIPRETYCITVIIDEKYSKIIPEKRVEAFIRHELALRPVDLVVGLYRLLREVFEGPMGHAVSAIIRQNIIIKRPDVIHTGEAVFHDLGHLRNQNTFIMIIILQFGI